MKTWYLFTVNLCNIQLDFAKAAYIGYLQLSANENEEIVFENRFP